MFSALVSNGALVDRETQDGRTAILYAIARDDAKTLEALVKVAGADVEFDSSFGVTPLSEAATANKPKCVEMLLSLGAKPLKSSRSNKVPVLQACLMGSIEVMKVLPSGADFWDSDPLGNGEYAIILRRTERKKMSQKLPSRVEQRFHTNQRVQNGRRLRWLGRLRNGRERSTSWSPWVVLRRVFAER